MTDTHDEHGNPHPESAPPLRHRPDRSLLDASLRHRRSAGIFCDGYRLIRRSWPGFAQHYDDYD
jgi:hypothetical protein